MNRFLLVLLTASMCAGCRSGEDATAGDERGEAEASRAEDKPAAAVTPAEWAGRVKDLLAQDKVEEAETFFLDQWKGVEERAYAAFGLIYTYHTRQGDQDAVVSWTRRLDAAGLPGNLGLRAFVLHLESLVASGACDEVAGLVPRIAGDVDESMRSRVLNHVLTRAVKEKGCDLDVVLTAVKQAGEQWSDAARVAAAFRADRLAAAGKWEEAEQQVMEVEADLPDAELAGLLNRLVPVCLSKQQGDLAQRLCEWALEQAGDRSAARTEAATQLLACLKKAQAPGRAVERFRGLLESDFPARELVPVFEAFFYYVVGKGEPEQVEAMREMGMALRKRGVGGKYAAWLKQLELDASFVLEDFDRALEIVQEGIPGRDRQWKLMATVKIKAHRALKEDRKEQAIEHFRTFMEYVRKWKEPELDPASGMTYTPNMTLGRNAKRIGDIYRSMGRKEEARTAYHEASEYYKAAVREVKSDSPEFHLLMREFTKIPADPLI